MAKAGLVYKITNTVNGKVLNNKQNTTGGYSFVYERKR